MPFDAWTYQRLINNDPNLTLVALGDENLLYDSEAKFLAQALINNVSVESLHLAGGQVSDNGARELAYMLAKNQSLLVLNLHDNQISNIGAKELAQGLAQNNALTR